MKKIVKSTYLIILSDTSIHQAASGESVLTPLITRRAVFCDFFKSESEVER